MESAPKALTLREKRMLRFIRKRLLPGPNHLQFYWGVTATVSRDQDGGIKWVTFDGVTLEEIYWHLRQEHEKERRNSQQDRQPGTPTKRAPRWDPKARELTMGPDLTATWKRSSERANSQVALLDAAQNAGWAGSFPNPYRRKELQTSENPHGFDEETARIRVHDLNERLFELGFAIRFSTSFDIVRVSCGGQGLPQTRGPRSSSSLL